MIKEERQTTLKIKGAIFSFCCEEFSNSKQKDMPRGKFRQDGEI